MLDTKDIKKKYIYIYYSIKMKENPEGRVKQLLDRGRVKNL